MRILFVASEGLPFCKTGGLADVIEALPKALVAHGTRGGRVAAALPRTRAVKYGHDAEPDRADGRRAALPGDCRRRALHGVHYFFVDDPEYFDRDQLYGVAGKDYPDNAERFAEFSRAAIELTQAASGCPT